MTPTDTSRAPAFPPETGMTLIDIGGADQAILVTDEAKAQAWTNSELERCGFGQPRILSELPPIEDTAVLDQYPDCLPRTPIDPCTTIKAPGIQKGNADLQPATWNPPAWVKPIIGAAE